MRVTLVISSLDPGGAERVASVLASHWAGMGRPVTILTFDDGSARPFYELDPHVCHAPLGIAAVSGNWPTALGNNLRRVLNLRVAIRASSPDVVVSFTDTTNVLTLCATRGLGIPVLVAEHTDPVRHRLRVVWKALRLLTYGWADEIVVLSERSRAYFPVRIRARTTVIPNPVVLDGWRPAQWAPPVSRPLVLAMGRLSEEKGHDLLLQAFARVKDRFPEWTLMVLGEGALRPRLEALSQTLGLSGRVQLPGTVGDPLPILRRADLFVLPSRWEVFPLALCEAMACGTPVIASEYHEGVREIVQDGIDGVIVPREDVGALADAMGRLMADRDTRRRLGSRAAGIAERYGRARVMEMWEALLERHIGRPRVRAGE